MVLSVIKMYVENAKKKKVETVNIIPGNQLFVVAFVVRYGPSLTQF